MDFFYLIKSCGNCYNVIIRANAFFHKLMTKRDQNVNNLSLFCWYNHKLKLNEDHNLPNWVGIEKNVLISIHSKFGRKGAQLNCKVFNFECAWSLFKTFSSAVTLKTQLGKFCNGVFSLEKIIAFQTFQVLLKAAHCSEY